MDDPGLQNTVDSCEISAMIKERIHQGPRWIAGGRMDTMPAGLSMTMMAGLRKEW